MRSAKVDSLAAPAAAPAVAASASLLPSSPVAAAALTQANVAPCPERQRWQQQQQQLTELGVASKKAAAVE